MRITRLQLKNFKRFTDLTIEAIPKEAKLVLLIGSNGSGKSSVFDAFNSFARLRSPVRMESSYYLKNDLHSEISILFDDGSKINSKDDILEDTYKKSYRFIGRSSIRIVPRISNSGDPDTVVKNNDGPPTFIDPDTRFDNDLSNVYAADRQCITRACL